MKKGTFPKMYSIAPMRVGFVLDDVPKWQADLTQNEIRPSEPVRVLVRTELKTGPHRVPK